MKQFDIGYSLRWILLLGSLICLIAGLFGMGVGTDSGNTAPFGLVLIVGVILLAQWLFLRPCREWRARLTESGRPMRTAMVVAAFMAMLLSAGLLLTALEICSPDGKWMNIFGEGVFYGICLGLWVVWSLVFIIYWQQAERFVQLRNMIHGLIAGSFLELFVAIGVYSWNRHDNSCYCERGSFLGLAFGATVMIWAFGPGLILLFLKKQRDKKSRQGQCPAPP